MINKKIKAAIEARLRPILCIGESLREREEEKTPQIVKKQLESALHKISARSLSLTSLSIAYEPVWAIGTGKPCDINTAQTMNLLIRKIIARIFSYSISRKLRILYGGSVNSKNAAVYISEANFQGLLVGGVSLDSQGFTKIVKEVSRG
jgi:triosephosphate isomerase